MDEDGQKLPVEVLHTSECSFQLEKAIGLTTLLIACSPARSDGQDALIFRNRDGQAENGVWQDGGFG